MKSLSIKKWSFTLLPFRNVGFGFVILFGKPVGNCPFQVLISGICCLVTSKYQLKWNLKWKGPITQPGLDAVNCKKKPPVCDQNCRDQNGLLINGGVTNVHTSFHASIFACSLVWLSQDKLLFCDSCDKGYHMSCHYPPVFKKPEGNVPWCC